MADEKVYFPGLNGIRAIAAFIVLVFHIDLTSETFGIKELGFHKTNMAGYGVVLFFVLSGYLITSLLLKEKNKYNAISISSFYTRRVLRIWPLYYLALLIGILLVLFKVENNAASLFHSIFLYIFFVPNVAFVLKIAIAAIAPLWSVGVEEQFYAIWPWIIKKSKRVFNGLIMVIIIYFIIKVIARFSGSPFFYNLISISSIDCMAIGGIGAYLVMGKSKIIKYSYNNYIQAASWMILIFSCFYKPIHILSIIDQEINAVVYLILIINVSSNPKPLISLENKLFDYLGKISYGIYVYHFIIIIILSNVLKGHVAQSLSGYIFLYIFVIGCTLIIASLSYKYYELRFLNLRKKYTIIQSSNSRYSN